MTACKVMLLALSVLCVFGVASARAADPEEEHGFLDRIHKDADSKEAKYVVFVPADYTGEKPFPLILFLHGLGESGDDGKKQTTVGLGPAIKKREKTFPFITVFPQSQQSTWDADKSDAQRALTILDEVQKELKVDPKRVYLTGLSLGGHGTWSLAGKYPEQWAAIAPVCGWGDPDDAKKIKDLPCWCFHGDADQAVKVEESRKMIKALQDAGAKPIYDEYPGVEHNSWDQAYATDELYEWLLKQQRK